MAATLFSKARLAALSIAHSVLDKAIDMNSVEAVKQNIRDLETSSEELEKSLATHRGLNRGLVRDVEELKSRKTDLDGQINSLLTDNDPSNDHNAATLEAELMGVEPLLADKVVECSDMDGTLKMLVGTHSRMKAKLTTMRGQLSRLQSMEHTAKTKESAAAAMRQAKETMSSGVDASVDSVAARLQKRYDIADEQLKSASEGFTDAVHNDTVMASVAARLAKRQAALKALKDTPEATAAPAAN